MTNIHQEIEADVKLCLTSIKYFFNNHLHYFVFVINLLNVTKQLKQSHEAQTTDKTKREEEIECLVQGYLLGSINVLNYE